MKFILVADSAKVAQETQSIIDSIEDNAILYFEVQEQKYKINTRKADIEVEYEGKIL